MRNGESLAWAAGLFEGEGCISFSGRACVHVSIGMTDQDVVDRFVSIVGGGYRYTTKDDFPHKKLYSWQVSSRQEVLRVIEKLLPYLGERRSRKAREAIERLNSNNGKPSERTHCVKGHEYNAENTYVYPGKTHRRCRTCDKVSLIARRLNA